MVDVLSPELDLRPSFLSDNDQGATNPDVTNGTDDAKKGVDDVTNAADDAKIQASGLIVEGGEPALEEVDSIDGFLAPVGEPVKPAEPVTVGN